MIPGADEKVISKRYNCTGTLRDCGDHGNAKGELAVSSKCPNCGRGLKGDSSFCAGCGADLSAGDTGEESPRTVLVGESDEGKKGSTETVIVSGREELPSTFGRYRVLREVGRGAMGIVYLARDDKISRNVAIKTLHLDTNLPEDDSKEISERFNREAQAAGMLSHPNIVTVYDVGEEGGSFYIAMEYLEGATLTEITSDGPLSIPQATDIITQVLSALSYAHSRDVVHRDIKPDNVFLLPDGRVKVVDFGIARLTSTSTMTQVGQVMGTPGYMSPEQVKGETVGPASDTFSVGVLFYELLTGTAAFHSTSATSIMYKIVHEEPKPPHLLNPGVPPNLEAVIARATAKSPGARYPDASRMKEDIATGAVPMPAPVPAAHDGTVLRGESISQAMPPSAAVPTPAPTAPAKKKTGLLIGLIGGGVALAAVVAVVVVLLLSGKGVTIEIESPKAGATVSGGEVQVELDVSNPDRVAKVELYVDGQKQGTIGEAPFEKAKISTGGVGEHELKASAYDEGGAEIAWVTGKYESTEGPGGETGDYKTDVAPLIQSANSMQEQIKGYANRINSEMSSGIVSAATVGELNDLLNRANGLAQSSAGLNPPADYQDIKAQFTQLCEYLRVRAESLVKGSQAWNAGGRNSNYLAEFNVGAAAKSSFDAAWPGFISNCRGRGISV